MKVIIKEVHTEDWKAVYINDVLFDEGHRVDSPEICKQLQMLIDNDSPIDSIAAEYYCLDDFEYGFPNNFNDIPKDGLWLMDTDMTL